MAAVVQNNRSEDSSNHANMPGTPPGTNNATKKLIINYLPRCVTQEELYNMFSTIGKIKSCVLMCNKTSFESLCYGFVEYFQPEDAANAIKVFHRMEIQNKVLKVSYARPSSLAITNANLYVKGLPKEFTITDLEKLFSPYGKIIDSRILCYNEKDNCCSREVGFVRFDKRAEAENAIKKLNGVLLAGMVDKPLLVKFTAHSDKESYNQPAHFVNPRYQRSGGHYMKFNNNGMNSNPQPRLGSYNSMNRAIQNTVELRSNNGRMNHKPHSLPSLLDYRHMQPNIQYTFGDASCMPMQATTSQMGTEIQALQNYHPMQGTPLYHSKLPGYDTKNNLGWSLFVTNFPPDTDENALWQLFSYYGVVSTVKIKRHTDSRRVKNYAFVTMANYFQATTAIHWLNGYIINNYSLHVSFQYKGGKTGPNKN